MIHSLFLINCSGDIFLEKHWKSVVSQSVCDYFFEAQEKAADVENVPPIISTPHHYLISIYRDKLFFVSVIQTEVPPLFVIEFLHRVADTFQVCIRQTVVTKSPKIVQGHIHTHTHTSYNRSFECTHYQFNAMSLVTLQSS